MTYERASACPQCPDAVSLKRRRYQHVSLLVSLMSLWVIVKWAICRGIVFLRIALGPEVTAN